ncbi:MAG: OadG family protein [Candidatus Cloacimonadaceae bacterium]|jgi:hypothetical protein|nr:OadG family protein [Candidatus Cloacimonadota bacterium]MDY0128191.1 OadG family protein [Candidatus Cloacimonadaceae bacterium]MCB5255016.1 OadG family protein [Candidatus Cloacimonadota bacterium]MCK9179141.1 OadG family protein [Candidatus Cloacimonadota bacterium]MCK9242732.1 OadG family protein [Candidatus Cloacimonadota bacterium]
MRKILCLALLIIPLLLPAQNADKAQSSPTNGDAKAQAVPDSLTLVREREREILSEYSFTDANTLVYVAGKLNIENLSAWKAALGLEPANMVLDTMTLRKLEITPYRALLAQQTLLYGFNELNTVSEIAVSLSIPIKKLKAMLGNPDPLDKSWDDTSIQALGIELDTIKRTHDKFTEDIVLYGSSVTLVGMLVVFTALVLTSIIISQLVHLNREKKQARVISLSSDGQVKSAPKNLDRSVIVAAITALHIHQMELEDRRKMVLTFRRTPINQWRASAIMTMPNREMNPPRSK